jgi:hypothetical protein
MIGHSNYISCTVTPSSYYDEANDIMIMDSPGFLDTRGTEMAIANAVNIKNAIMKAKSVRLVVLVDQSSFEAAKGAAVQELLKATRFLLGSQK